MRLAPLSSFVSSTNTPPPAPCRAPLAALQNRHHDASSATAACGRSLLRHCFNPTLFFFSLRCFAISLRLSQSMQDSKTTGAPRPRHRLQMHNTHLLSSVCGLGEGRAERARKVVLSGNAFFAARAPKNRTSHFALHFSSSFSSCNPPPPPTPFPHSVLHPFPPHPFPPSAPPSFSKKKIPPRG